MEKYSDKLQKTLNDKKNILEDLIWNLEMSQQLCEESKKNSYMEMLEANESVSYWLSRIIEKEKEIQELEEKLTSINNWWL